MALARAVFGDPCLVVLDEPNSNLDAQGDKALNAAIQYMRAQNKTVIIVSHRPAAMAAVNKVLVLKGGQQEKFGLRDDILNVGNRVPPAQTMEQLKRAQDQARQLQEAHQTPTAEPTSTSVNTGSATAENPYQNQRA